MDNQLTSLIRAFMRDRKITQQKVSEVTGLSQPTISSMLSGVIRPQRLIDALVENFGATPADFDMTSKIVSKGIPCYDILPSKGGVPIRYVALPHISGVDFAVLCPDAGMEPLVGKGDILLMRCLAEAQLILYGKLYLIEMEDGTILLRRVESSKKEGEILLVPEKMGYSQQIFAIGKVKSLYIVAGVLKIF